MRLGRRPLPTLGEAPRPIRIFYDDFDKSRVAALNWKLTAGTGALALTAAAQEFMTGGQGLKYTSSTVASEAAEIHRLVAPVRTDGLLLFGGAFALEDANLGSIAFNLSWRDATNRYQMRARHTVASGVWAWFDSSNAAQTFLTRDAQPSSSIARWHQVLLVADYGAVKQRLVQADDTYVSSVGALRSAADTTGKNLLDFGIELTNGSGTPSASIILIDRLFAYWMRSTDDIQAVLADLR